MSFIMQRNHYSEVQIIKFVSARISTNAIMVILTTIIVKVKQSNRYLFMVKGQHYL